MSLEESMLKLAEANNRLADATTKYAAVVEANTEVLKSIHAQGGVSFVGAAPSGDTPTAATPAGKPGRKPKETPAAAAPAVAEPDPFGDDDDLGGEPEKTYTAADIKAGILKVRDKGGEKKNEAAARAILKEIGVDSIGKIAESDYPKVMALVEKALK
jgi:hypothetical protein